MKVDSVLLYTATRSDIQDRWIFIRAVGKLRQLLIGEFASFCKELITLGIKGTITKNFPTFLLLHNHNSLTFGGKWRFGTIRDQDILFYVLKCRTSRSNV